MYQYILRQTFYVTQPGAAPPLILDSGLKCIQWWYPMGVPWCDRWKKFTVYWGREMPVYVLKNRQKNCLGDIARHLLNFRATEISLRSFDAESNVFSHSFWVFVISSKFEKIWREIWKSRSSTHGIFRCQKFKKHGPQKISTYSYAGTDRRCRKNKKSKKSAGSCKWHSKNGDFLNFLIPRSTKILLQFFSL